MTSATIHPRLRDRRIHIARMAGRRRLRRLEWVLIVAVVIAGVWALLRSPAFDLDSVDVAGAVRTTDDEVLAALGASDATPLLDIEPLDVQRRLVALPWVATAEVERVWPATISVELTERRPVAVVASLESAARRVGWSASTRPMALVDADGRVLDYRASAPAGLPEVVGVAPAGVPGSDVEAPVLLEVAALLSSELATEVETIELRGGDVWLVLDDGAGVQVGGPDELADKLVAAATVVSQVDRLGVDVIDVRVPAAPVVRRR